LEIKTAWEPKAVMVAVNSLDVIAIGRAEMFNPGYGRARRIGFLTARFRDILLVSSCHGADHGQESFRRW